MPFANIVENAPFESKFKKAEYIDLPVGTSVIRILDKEAYQTSTHYVRGAYVECIGDNCPICKMNHSIISAHPKDYASIQGYSSRSARFITNVLDRTPAKLCPSCSKYNKKVGNAFPATCECGASLMGVKEAPINKIRVLAKGKELYSQFNALELSILDTNQEQIGLQNFDIALFVTGIGKDKKTTAIPLSQQADDVSALYAEEDKFDTSKSTLRLTENEIISLLKGTAIRDILLGRGATKDTPNSSTAEDTEETKESLVNTDVQEQIKALFGE